MISTPMILFTAYITFLLIIFGSIVIRTDNVEKKIDRLSESIKKAEKMPNETEKK